MRSGAANAIEGKHISRVLWKYRKLFNSWREELIDQWEIQVGRAGTWRWKNKARGNTQPAHRLDAEGRVASRCDWSKLFAEWMCGILECRVGVRGPPENDSADTHRSEACRHSLATCANRTVTRSSDRRSFVLHRAPRTVYASPCQLGRRREEPRMDVGEVNFLGKRRRPQTQSPIRPKAIANRLKNIYEIALMRMVEDKAEELPIDEVSS